MLSRNFILLALDAFGGSIKGKTLLQKRIFFLQELLGNEPRMEYRAHYFGPYSDAVSDDTGFLRASGLVQEEALSFGSTDPRGFERSRYDYKLTEDGIKAVDFLKQRYPEEARSIQNAVERLKAAGNLDYVALSVAAKTYFILTNAEKLELTEEGIRREAKTLGWDIDPQQVDQAISFLGRLLPLKQTTPAK